MLPVRRSPFFYKTPTVSWTTLSSQLENWQKFSIQLFWPARKFCRDFKNHSLDVWSYKGTDAAKLHYSLHKRPFHHAKLRVIMRHYIKTEFLVWLVFYHLLFCRLSALNPLCMVFMTRQPLDFTLWHNAIGQPFYLVEKHTCSNG